MSIREEDGVIIAHVTFGQAYEGPPGCVHGGYVAAAFDEVLGATQSLSGAGHDGHAHGPLREATPAQDPAAFHEGRLVGVERRKIFTEGSCFVGDTLTASAKGTFISMQPGRSTCWPSGPPEQTTTADDRTAVHRTADGVGSVGGSALEVDVDRRSLGHQVLLEPDTMACSTLPPTNATCKP